MKKKLFQKAVILLIVLPLVFAGLVGGQPAPIGDPSFTQTECFDSNPTTGSFSDVGTPSGDITNAFDGDLGTNINFMYGAGNGYVEVAGFKKPSDNGLSDFTITFVDLKIHYRAGSTGIVDDRYRIVAYVDPSATPIVLQDWVNGTTGAAYPPGVSSNPGIRAFSNVSEPNDGVWDWADLASLRVRFEIEVVNTNNFQRVYEHEVWVTAYSTPYPEPGTMSVQTPIIGGLTAGDLFYVDIYITNVEDFWGYEFVLTFDPAILAPIEYISYSPFVSGLPSEIGPNYVSVSYGTYSGDPVGFTGNTPITRIYFGVVADGASVLSFTKAEGADIYGVGRTFIPRNGVFASSLVRNLAVTVVTVNATSILPGEILRINATVANQGSVTETFNVTAFYDSTVIETKTVANLTAGASKDLNLFWNTSGIPVGFHQIKVEADTVVGESNIEDNVKVFGDVIVGRHDIAVTNIVRAYANDTVAPPGVLLNVTRADLVHINVTVENLGTFSETFNLTLVWKGALVIENKTNVQLDPGTSQNLTFIWDTDFTTPEWVFGFDQSNRPINFSRGDVRAVATPLRTGQTISPTGVPFEKGVDYDYTGNNALTDGEVRVNRDFLAPSAFFLVNPGDAFVTQPVQFMSVSQTPSGTTIVNHRWDFGDGNITEVSSSTIYHPYASEGSYYVSLWVFNDLGKRGRVATGQEGAPTQPVIVTVRNVKVVSIDVSPTTAVIGENVTIRVTVKNEGADESLAGTKKNMTVYFGDSVAVRVRAPDVGGANTATNTTTLVLNWTTTGLSPGVHTIKAVLDDLGYETSTSDNIVIFAEQVTLLWHNIKVTGITTSKSEASIGESVTVSVAALNYGNFTETFTVTLYVNGTLVGSAQTVSDLAAGASGTVDFSWSTADLESGVYVFRAVASNVTLEAVTTDNTYDGGSVTLSPASNMLLYIIIGAAAVIVVLAVVGVYFLKFRKPK